MTNSKTFSGWNITNIVGLLILPSAAVCLLFARTLANPKVTLVLHALFVAGLLLFENQRRDFVNPAVVYSIFFFLYSTWYALYRLFVSEEPDSFLLNQSLSVSFFGHIVFYSCYLLAGIYFRRQSNQARKRTALRRKVDYENGVLLSFVFLAVMVVLEVIASGSTSKLEVTGSGLLSKRLFDGAVPLLMIVLVLRVRRDLAHDSLRQDRLLIVFAFILSLLLLFTGERDYVFRLAIGLVFIYFDWFKSATNARVLLLVALILVVLPLSQALKAVLLNPSSFSFALSVQGLLVGEFINPGRNLYMLLQHGTELHPEFIMTDIARALMPGAEFFGFNSTGYWYHHVYRYEHGFGGPVGWGLGIVPQGWLIGRQIGVILLMSFQSLLLTAFYWKRNKSELHYAFYINLLTISIYAIRADLSNILAQAVRTPVIAILVLVVLRSFRNGLRGTEPHSTTHILNQG